MEELLGPNMAVNGSWLTIGDVDGEKEKFCWKGPAEVMKVSASRLAVSRA